MHSIKSILFVTSITRGKIDAEDTLFLERWKRCPLKKASITAEMLPSGRLSLSSDKPAFYVSLELPGSRGQFSDNMFTLIPGREKAISFSPSSYGQGDENSVFTKTLEKNIRILSLKDTYMED